MPNTLPAFAYCYMDQAMSQFATINLFTVVTVTLASDETCWVASIADGSRRYFSHEQWKGIEQRMGAPLGVVSLRTEV